MNVSERNLKLIIQVLLLAVVAIIPFIKTGSLYFPFVSGKVYAFRALIALAVFFWVWLLLKEKRAKSPASAKAAAGGQEQNFFSPFKNVLVVAIVLFFLAQVIASFFGVDPLYSFFSSIERADGVLQYGFWVLYFLMLVSVFRKELDWKVFFLVSIVVAVALSVYSWYSQGWQTQLSGVFGNPAYFAAFLLFAIGFSLVAFERKFFYPGPVHYALLAAAGLFILTLVFIQVRGVYVGLVGGVFLFSFLSLLFLRKEHKRLAFAGGAVLLTGLISLGILFLAKDTDLVKNTRLLYRITEVADFWESDSVRERVLNWNIALKSFRERPLFGYGPENFGAAANKYYDYRIGKGEPWFDRAHNQPLDTLATGGIVVFSFYLFWLGAASFLIYKIAKRQKVLGFLLAGIFAAYFLQGFFLFDLLAVYLGLFPFLAFLVYQSNPVRGKQVELAADFSSKENRASNGAKYILLVPVALFSLFVVYTTTIVPYKANAAAIQFFAYSESGFYKESRPFLETAFSVKSPYTFWEVRKRASWQFVNILEYEVGEKTKPEKIKEIKDLYDFMTPELEKFIEAKPYDPQMYYVLGRTYRFGYEKLGLQDLDKAEAVFRKAFLRSDLRVEYFNEFAKVLLLQGKFEEAEKSVKDYLQRVSFYDYFPYVTLGHFYFVAEGYEQAFEQYEKAREVGYKFEEVTPEYSRYMFVAEEMGEYQKVVDMARTYLVRWGPDADTYFNIAVGYFNLGDQQTAREFFQQALLLKPEYEEYRPFFFE